MSCIEGPLPQLARSSTTKMATTGFILRPNASGKPPRANEFPIATAARSRGSFQSDCQFPWRPSKSTNLSVSPSQTATPQTTAPRIQEIQDGTNLVHRASHNAAASNVPIKNNQMTTPEALLRYALPSRANSTVKTGKNANPALHQRNSFGVAFLNDSPLESLSKIEISHGMFQKLTISVSGPNQPPLGCDFSTDGTAGS